MVFSDSAKTIAPSPAPDCGALSAELESTMYTLWFYRIACGVVGLFLAIVLSLMMCFPHVLVKCVDGVGEMERRRWHELKLAKGLDVDKRTGNRTFANQIAISVLKKAEKNKKAHDLSQMVKKKSSMQRLEKRLADRMKDKRGITASSKSPAKVRKPILQKIRKQGHT